MQIWKFMQSNSLRKFLKGRLWQWLHEEVDKIVLRLDMLDFDLLMILLLMGEEKHQGNMLGVAAFDISFL